MIMTTDIGSCSTSLIRGKANQNYYEIPHLLGWLLQNKTKQNKTRDMIYREMLNTKTYNADNNIGKDVKKREPYTLLVGM